jgi:hypothetical protein
MAFHVARQNLRDDEGLIATSRKRFADEPLGTAVRKHFCGVDQRHPVRARSAAICS